MSSRKYSATSTLFIALEKHGYTAKVDERGRPAVEIPRQVAPSSSRSLLRTELTMKVLAAAEAALKEVERDSDRLQSKELREAIQQHIDQERQAIKALRKFYN